MSPGRVDAEVVSRHLAALRRNARGGVPRRHRSPMDGSARPSPMRAERAGYRQTPRRRGRPGSRRLCRGHRLSGGLRNTAARFRRPVPRRRRVPEPTRAYFRRYRYRSRPCRQVPVGKPGRFRGIRPACRTPRRRLTPARATPPKAGPGTAGILPARFRAARRRRAKYAAQCTDDSRIEAMPPSRRRRGLPGCAGVPARTSQAARAPESRAR